MAYIRQVVQNREQRIAVSLHDDQGRKKWCQSTASDGRNGIDAFVFDLQAGAQEATLEIILLEPVQSEFVVKPTIVEPTGNSKREQ